MRVACCCTKKCCLSNTPAIQWQVIRKDTQDALIRRGLRSISKMPLAANHKGHTRVYYTYRALQLKMYTILMHHARHSARRARWTGRCLDGADCVLSKPMPFSASCTSSLEKVQFFSDHSACAQSGLAVVCPILRGTPMRLATARARP